MKKYIISLDQGTTSSRAVAFDKNGCIAGMCNREFRQIFPKPGWVEHDPYDILNSQTDALRGLIKSCSISPWEIDSIGITNQRETVVVWDRETGKPVYNAIVWQCRRTAPLCEEIKEKGHAGLIREKTGLVPDAYFSATKIRWILDNVPGARDLSHKNRLMAGTVDTWLIYNLSDGKVHVTDAGNASRTMLYNIIKGEWDPALLKIFDIPESMLPLVVPSSGFICSLSLEGVKIPVTGAAGDQQAALFGQACFQTGEAKNTYGTGCFILMNTGNKPVFSKKGLLSTVAWNVNGRTVYALEGSVFNAGSSIQWLRDQMGFIQTAAESEACALEAGDTGGVYFVPAFTGLGTPHWDMYARGTIVGITRGTGRNHIVRATLESIAYQSNDVLKCMEEDSGIRLKGLKVDGGACANDFLMQFQADILGMDVIRPCVRETTALGAAFLAGLSTGFFPSLEDISLLPGIERVFNCRIDEASRNRLTGRWEEAVKRSRNWAIENG
jgi:glycerol kinase